MFNSEYEMCGGKKTILPDTRSVFIKLRLDNVDQFFPKGVSSKCMILSNVKFPKRQFPKCTITEKTLSQVHNFPKETLFL